MPDRFCADAADAMLLCALPTGVRLSRPPLDWLVSDPNMASCTACGAWWCECEWLDARALAGGVTGSCGAGAAGREGTTDTLYRDCCGADQPAKERSLVGRVASDSASAACMASVSDAIVRGRGVSE